MIEDRMELSSRNELLPNSKEIGLVPKVASALALGR
jgi:hypothetical protein